MSISPGEEAEARGREHAGPRPYRASDTISGTIGSVPEEIAHQFAEPSACLEIRPGRGALVARNVETSLRNDVLSPVGVDNGVTDKEAPAECSGPP